MTAPVNGAVLNGFSNNPQYLDSMNKALLLDLKKLKSRAFHMAESAEQSIRHYHSANSLAKGDDKLLLGKIYSWLFAPPTLWPFHVQDVLEECLHSVEKGKALPPRHRLIIEMLPGAPSEKVCSVVAGHERHVQEGVYENLLHTQSKFTQTEIAIRANAQLQGQWASIKAAFKVHVYRDHKGVIRRTMGAERNLRPTFAVNPRRAGDLFRAAFDAFCLRWNLYGMENDEPLLLKLSVNITPFGTMIHIPSYWSFDPKRDVLWDAIAKLHRVRVSGRQGPALAEGLAERKIAADKLRRLDKEVLKLGLKGEKKHEFLCTGLNWDSRTSPKRISRLREEFKDKQAVSKRKGADISTS
ncbi:hypothetical protein BH11VER1_BH11VER1_09000 [soil metagenome]